MLSNKLQNSGASSTSKMDLPTTEFLIRRETSTLDLFFFIPTYCKPVSCAVKKKFQRRGNISPGKFILCIKGVWISKYCTFFRMATELQVIFATKGI
jgi:hypothetical protein